MIASIFIAVMYAIHWLIVLWFVGMAAVLLFSLLLFALVIWEWWRDGRNDGRAM